MDSGFLPSEYGIHVETFFLKTHCPPQSTNIQTMHSLQWTTEQKDNMQQITNACVRTEQHQSHTWIETYTQKEKTK